MWNSPNARFNTVHPYLNASRLTCSARESHSPSLGKGGSTPETATTEAVYLLQMGPTLPSLPDVVKMVPDQIQIPTTCSKSGGTSFKLAHLDKLWPKQLENCATSSGLPLQDYVNRNTVYNFMILSRQISPQFTKSI